MVALVVVLGCVRDAASLHETHRATISDPFDVEGARPSESGDRYIVWSAGDRRVLVIDSLLKVQSDIRTVGQPVGAFLAGDTVELLEREPLTYTRMVDGRVIRSSQLSTSWATELVSSAARVGPGKWLLVVEDATTRHRLHLLTILGEAGSWPTVREILFTDSNPAQGLRMSRHDVGVIATELRPPYRSFVVDADGRIEQLGSADLGEAGVDVAVADSLRWIALPPVAVTGGYLQILADLHSDARVVLTLDERGRMRRAKRVEVPIGFLTSSRDRVLAVARLNQRILVEYELRK